jgi:hypothetical protein
MHWHLVQMPFFFKTWLLGLNLVTLLGIVAMVRRHVVVNTCADYRLDKWAAMKCARSDPISIITCWLKEAFPNDTSKASTAHRHPFVGRATK